MVKAAFRKRAFIWLLALAIAWLCLALIQSNWTLHARLNLLARGYVFCHLVDPGATHRPALPTNQVISMLVYKGGVCIGYLDVYAQFVALTDKAPDPSAQTVRMLSIDLGLFYLRWLLVLAGVAVLFLAQRKERANVENNRT